MQQIFEQNETPALLGVVLWIPMLEADNLAAAKQRESQLSDPRLAQLWDEKREFGRLFAQSLALQEQIAWDVYLVYSPSATWGTALPPAPSFWMHQLDEEPSRRLDPLFFKRYVNSLLERNSPS